MVPEFSGTIKYYYYEDYDINMILYKSLHYTLVRLVLIPLNNFFSVENILPSLIILVKIEHSSSKIAGRKNI